MNVSNDAPRQPRTTDVFKKVYECREIEMYVCAQTVVYYIVPGYTRTCVTRTCIHIHGVWGILVFHVFLHPGTVYM